MSSMTWSSRMADAHDRDRLPEYALGLLNEAERARVETHVRECASCARELAAYHETADMLPEALPPAQAPEAAWNAIAARIRPVRAGPHRTRVGGRASAWARLQPALIAVLAVAVIGLGGWNAWLQSQLPGDGDPAISSLVYGSGGPVTVVTLVAKPGTSGVGGRLVMSHDRTEGGLVVGGMPALQPGQAYEIWFVREDQSRVPANTFTVDSQGQAVFLVDVPQPADSFDGVAITTEPSAGSSTPTGPDLLAGLIYQN
jgi:anti-sigma-K factor RskA